MLVIHYFQMYQAYDFIRSLRRKMEKFSSETILKEHVEVLSLLFNNLEGEPTQPKQHNEEKWRSRQHGR